MIVLLCVLFELCIRSCECNMTIIYIQYSSEKIVINSHSSARPAYPKLHAQRALAQVVITMGYKPSITFNFLLPSPCELSDLRTTESFSIRNRGPFVGFPFSICCKTKLRLGLLVVG